MHNGVTEYRVREVLRTSHGIGVSHGQLATWRGWGLLKQDEDGQWSPETIERVLRIHELGRTVDSIARRVILLQGEAGKVRFTIPPDQLQRAMMVVAPKITPHLHKMKRVDRAVRELVGATRPGGRTGSTPKGWRPPPREEWVPLLRATEVDRFHNAATAQYYFLGVLKTLVPGEGNDALSQIPEEELLTLMTIRHLATQEAGRNRADKGLSQDGEIDSTQQYE